MIEIYIGIGCLIAILFILGSAILYIFKEKVEDGVVLIYSAIIIIIAVALIPGWGLGVLIGVYYLLLKLLKLLINKFYKS